MNSEHMHPPRSMAAAKITYDEFVDQGLLNLVAGIACDDEIATAILERIRYPREHVPTWHSADTFWREVCRQIDHGRTEGGIARLLHEIALMYRYNETLTPWRNLTAATAAGNAHPETAGSHGPRLVVSRFQGSVATLLENVRRLAAAQRIPGRVEMRLAVTGHVVFSLPAANQEMALALREAIAGQVQNPHPLIVSVVAASHEEYILRRLYVEGPDQERFMIPNVPSTTTMAELGRAAMSQYSSDVWPRDHQDLPRPVVVDFDTPAGSTQRAEARSTVGDNQLRENANVRVNPESTMGSLHPQVRAAGLARVKVQLQQFQRRHPGTVMISGFDDLLSEDYRLEFSVPGFGFSETEGRPVRVDHHRARIHLGINFPMSAPIVFWETNIFHPNVHPATHKVCLGELDKSWVPAFNFEKLCQLIIDLAGYRNYETRNAYNQDAVTWSNSEEGKSAIEQIGGRSSLSRFCDTFADTNRFPLVIERLVHE